MPPRIPTEDLISDLQETAAKHGEPLTYREYSEYGSHSPEAVKERFDGWNNGKTAAGLEVGEVGEAKPVDVLNDLRKVADSKRGISAIEYLSVGTLSQRPVLKYFDRWWKGTVSAGLLPMQRRPLTPKQFDQYYQAVGNLSAKIALPFLLFMNSGMSSQTAVEMLPNWVQENRDKNIIRVPSEYANGDPWIVRLPETWVNPNTGERSPTTLPKTAEWVLENYNEMPWENPHSIRKVCFRLGKKAGIVSREMVSRRRVGEVPLIRPADLSYSHGANLVRQGVESEIIERRLGADGYRSRFHVDDVMLWVYVHDSYEHPEFDPPPVVLDPDTGEPRYS